MKLNVLFGAAVGTFLSYPCAASTPPALDSAVLAWSKQSSLPSYVYSLIDLDDDGVPDAVVLITDTSYCGSGGCSMAIFQGQGGYLNGNRQE